MLFRSKGIIIGYQENAYKIWDFKSKKIIVSKDIIILENSFIDNNIKDIDFKSIKELPDLPEDYNPLLKEKETIPLINQNH